MVINDKPWWSAENGPWNPYTPFGQPSPRLIR